MEPPEDKEFRGSKNTFELRLPVEEEEGEELQLHLLDEVEVKRLCLASGVLCV